LKPDAGTCDSKLTVLVQEKDDKTGDPDMFELMEGYCMQEHNFAVTF
jgi:hypothetical protein